MVNFAMVGLLFAMPQYFQAIEHTDALGNGLRLLPMIGGMLIGYVWQPSSRRRSATR